MVFLVPRVIVATSLPLDSQGQSPPTNSVTSVFVLVFLLS